MSSQKSQGDSKSVPDLYKLLGLKSLEKDPATVLAKIERLEVKAAKATDEKRAKQARKVASVARKQLCDPERKEKYDAAWRQTYAVQSAAVQSAAAKSNSGSVVSKEVGSSRPELNPQFTLLLPKGSPEAAFDLAAYLQNPGVVRFDPAQFARLAEAVRASENADSDPGFATQSSPLSSSQPAAGGVPPVLNTAAASAKASSALGSRLRSKRKKSLVVPIVGLLVCMVVVLGLTAYLVQPAGDASSVASQDNLGSANGPPRGVPRPRRSGLPQVQGLGTDPGEDGLGPGEVNDLVVPPVSDLQGLAGEIDADAMYGMPEPTIEQQPSMDLMASDPDMAMDAQINSEPMDMESDSSSTTMIAPGQSAPPIDDTLVAAGELASKYEYDAAMEKLQALSTGQLSASQSAQVERVDTLVGLAQQAHASLKSTLRDMSAGESFLVGTSAQVAFVSADDQKIVIRLRGLRREYTYAALPPGMLYSLLDMSLDAENPTARGAKGAFIVLQPNRNSRSIAKAREHLVAAVASGAFRDDLLNAIDDMAIE